MADLITFVTETGQIIRGSVIGFLRTIFQEELCVLYW